MNLEVNILKDFISYKNRGMLLETIINNSINHYNTYRIAFFAKNHLNIKFKKTNKNVYVAELNNAFIKGKSTVDYYGIFKGRYISFEAKSVEKSVFTFSNIRQHQHQHLKLIKELGGQAFYIIFFKTHSKIFKLDVEHVDIENKNQLTYQEVETKGELLDIYFPGIIDFLGIDLN